MEEKIRCFVAIDFPREVINEIERVQGELRKKKIFHGKFVEGENLHLTLKFLGEINIKKIKEVKKRLREIDFPDFVGVLSELGVFSQKFIRIVWIKILGSCVFELQKKIDGVLSKGNLFKKEERFMSHLTIARVKQVFDRKLFLKELKKISVRNLKFDVWGFCLMKSELKPEGPVYSVLGEYRLKRKI